MENLMLEAVKLVNPIEMFIIGLLFFFFYNRLDSKIDQSKKELKHDFLGLKQDFAALKQDFAALKQETKEMETRINMELKTLNQRIDSLYQLIVSVFKNAA